MANKTNSLSSTTWMCKYHIVFIPKYRRKTIYGQYRESLQEIIRTLCEYKGVEILEGHMMPDHVHLLLSIPPKLSVSSFMGYLKGKSALMMFDKHANLKYKFGNRHFWAEGYYVSTVGLNEATIRKYISDQEKHDIAMDSSRFYVDLVEMDGEDAVVALENREIAGYVYIPDNFVKGVTRGTNTPLEYVTGDDPAGFGNILENEIVMMVSDLVTQAQKSVYAAVKLAKDNGASKGIDKKIDRLDL